MAKHNSYQYGDYINNKRAAERFVYESRSVKEGVLFGIINAGISFSDKNYGFGVESPTRTVVEYIIGGKGYIELEGKVHEVSAGDSVVMRAGTKRKYYADKNDPYIKIWFSCIGKLVDSVLDGFSADPLTIVKRDSYRSIEKLLKSLEEKDADELRDFHHFTDITYKIFTSAHIPEPSEEPPLLHRIRSYIDIFAAESDSVDAIAKHFGISTRYLIEQFKKEFGTTPHKYIKERKLLIARSMIVGSSYSTSEIAGFLGFCEQGYLGKEFKKRFGVTPAELRKNPKVLTSEE